MNVSRTANMPEAIMPQFSYFDILTSKEDCIELFIYCCMWMMLEKMIQMYVPMTDKLRREMEEAGQDERKRKKLILKFEEYKESIRNFINGVFCVIFSTYYLFAYGLRVNTWCNGFEHTVIVIQVAHFLTSLILTF